MDVIHSNIYRKFYTTKKLFDSIKFKNSFSRNYRKKYNFSNLSPDNKLLISA